MRRYTDRLGMRWDVVIGRESFGALLALFVPASGNTGQPRQALLRSDSRVRADAELAAMDNAELDSLFERSEPKETG